MAYKNSTDLQYDSCSFQAKGSYSKFETFLMSLDIPNIIIPDCDLKQFEKIAFSNSRFLRMSLIEGQLEIIMPPLPVHYETDSPDDDEKLLLGDRKFEIIGQVYNWCEANKSSVGRR
ncbi:19542_t:CDS:2, partial [Racocetra fulgida]